MSYDVDFLVLGAGSAGVRASRIAAMLGAKVAVVEERYLGGTCVNVGCVPKKLMVYGAHFADELEEARGYGWEVEGVRHNWQTLKTNRDNEVKRLNGIYQRLLESKGVRIVRGRGVLADPHTVVVHDVDGNEERITAKHILIATGGVPVRPTIAGAEHVLISDQIFRLEERPQRLVVIGAGYIGVEFAGVFKAFGSDVTLVHRGEQILKGFDIDVREHLAAQYEHKGIHLRLSSEVKAVDKNADGSLSCHVVHRDGDVETIQADAVLLAIGRHPHTNGLGLEAAGVKVDERDAIVVDDDFQTSVPSITACGDVINRIQLTPVALNEGMVVARRLFGGPVTTIGYDAVPSAVFSSPPIGAVGLSEDDARAAGHAVEIYRSVFRPMKLTMTDRQEKSLMKIVVDKSTRRVLGMFVVGQDAGEIIQGFAVAVKMGVTKEQLDSTIGIHPTAAEELVTMREPVAEPDADEVRRRTAPAPGEL